MSSLCEFIITGVVTGASGVFHVIGRCGDVSFKVGDVFDQIDHPGEGTRPVSLQVTKITAYQRSLEEIGTGMTASIDVVGEGVDLLRPKSVLVASQSREALTASNSVVAGQESHV